MLLLPRPAATLVGVTLWRRWWLQTFGLWVRIGHLIRLKLRIRSRVLPSLEEEEAICEDLCLCDAGADGVRSMKMMP